VTVFENLIKVGLTFFLCWLCAMLSLGAAVLLRLN